MRPFDDAIMVFHEYETLKYFCIFTHLILHEIVLGWYYPISSSIIAKYKYVQQQTPGSIWHLADKNLRTLAFQV